MNPSRCARRLRATAVGAFTAALAVGAHAAAGGATPTGSAVALLGIVAIAVGAVAARVDRTADAGTLVGLLAAGQLLGHLSSAICGHPPTPGGPSGLTMLMAHAAAVVTGAGLISACDHLCAAVTSAWRIALRRRLLPLLVAPAEPAGHSADQPADQPMHSMFLLAASISHRGPPVSFAR